MNTDFKNNFYTPLNTLSFSSSVLHCATAPIGIFDSGVGGLSIWQAIRALLPQESLLYVADSLYAPYGDRSDTFIRARTLALGQWLIQSGVKALVIACNTATLQAVSALREQFGQLNPQVYTASTSAFYAPTLPIIGVEPAIKSAAQYSKSGVAGILATTSTLRSAAFARLLTTHASTCRFICQAGQGLVATIEQGETDSPTLRRQLASYLQPMLDAGADTLVLGSTHFPFLRDTINQVTASSLRLIETGEPVARQLQAQLALHKLLTPPNASPTLHFYTTAHTQHLQNFLENVLGFRQKNPAVHNLVLPT